MRDAALFLIGFSCGAGFAGIAAVVVGLTVFFGRNTQTEKKHG
ncbi:MAG: hypothetical protein ACKOEM_22045 [Planctomycetia bacterium]